MQASGIQSTKTIYIAAWAGDEVRDQTIHPPFNLTLRLLIALSKDVIIPISPGAAELLDEARKPFITQECATKDYSVQQRTASHTRLQVHLLHPFACDATIHSMFYVPERLMLV